MRPMYIEGKPGCRVVLDEPALRVTVPDKADRLFPLARISRVVCSGSVDWTMSALLACADAGIVVVMLSKTGEVRARWSGVCSDRQLFAQRLFDVLARPDGLDRYQTWLAAMEKMAARSFARRAGCEDWREVAVVDLQAGLRREGLRDWHDVEQYTVSLLYADMVLFFQEQGLDLLDESLSVSRLDLAADFSRLLVWDFYGSLLAMKRRSAQKPTQRALVELYQQRSERVRMLFRGTINKLHRFLLGVD